MHPEPIELEAALATVSRYRNIIIALLNQVGHEAELSTHDLEGSRSMPLYLATDAASVRLSTMGTRK